MINTKNDAENVLFSELFCSCKEQINKKGIEDISDLDFICCEVLGKSRAQLKLVRYITKSQEEKIKKAVQKRLKGEPVASIFNHTNFYGLDFYVNNDVLCPRNDTERLVECVINNCQNAKSICDVGTGSGAIAITLAKNTSCKITALDISQKALTVAKKNAKNNGVNVKFIQSNLFSGVGFHKKFDIIVSNPPYIPTKDIEKLDVEVKDYDPILALDGGKDGLQFYREIINLAPLRLGKNGKIFFEVGINQAQDVKKLLQKNFKDIRIVKDYNKIDRVVWATLDK